MEAKDILSDLTNLLSRLTDLIYPSSSVSPLFDELVLDYFGSAAYDEISDKVTLTLPKYNQYTEADSPSYANFHLVHEMAHLLHFQALKPDRAGSLTSSDIVQMEAFAFMTQFRYCRLLDFFPPANHFNIAMSYYPALNTAHVVYNGLSEPDYLLARGLRAVGWMK